MLLYHLSNDLLADLWVIDERVSIGQPLVQLAGFLPHVGILAVEGQLHHHQGDVLRHLALLHVVPQQGMNPLENLLKAWLVVEFGNDIPVKPAHAVEEFLCHQHEHVLFLWSQTCILFDGKPQGIKNPFASLRNHRLLVRQVKDNLPVGDFCSLIYNLRGICPIVLPHTVRVNESCIDFLVEFLVQQGKNHQLGEIHHILFGGGEFWH